MPKKELDIKTTVSLRLSIAEHTKLKELAEEKSRSVSYFVSLWAKEALAKIK